MKDFVSVLKSVENSIKKGREKDGWHIFKVSDNKKDTEHNIGYGHKLSKEEVANNYVIMPDGTKKDLSKRGLTDKEAEALFKNDIEVAKNKARVEWNKFHDVSFDLLPTVGQDLLSDIAFNAGTTFEKKNGVVNKDKFGWPKLAKGILDGDTEVMKKEISRKSETGKSLANRVKALRAFIDSNANDVVNIRDEVASQIRDNLGGNKAPPPVDNKAGVSKDSTATSSSTDFTLQQLLEEKHRREVMKNDLNTSLNRSSSGEAKDTTSNTNDFTLEQLKAEKERRVKLKRIKAPEGFREVSPNVFERIPKDKSGNGGNKVVPVEEIF